MINQDIMLPTYAAVSSDLKSPMCVCVCVCVCLFVDQIKQVNVIAGIHNWGAWRQLSGAVVEHQCWGSASAELLRKTTNHIRERSTGEHSQSSHKQCLRSD